MHLKSKTTPSATVDPAEAVPRVALTLKITKADYVRLTRLKLKELEAGHDLTHQEILYTALRNHLNKRGV
jgi:hypothetical protein